MNDTMQFRDYIFPHNPQSITVTRAAETAVHFCPGKGEVAQRLGASVRAVRCNGSFFGDSFEQAAAQLREFRSKAEREEPGTLFLPGSEPFAAHLRELTYEATGDGRIIPYSMLFVEAEAGA